MTAPAVPAVPAAPAEGTQAPPPSRRKRTPRSILNTILWYGAAVVMALFIIVPIYLIFISATTPADATYNYPKSLVPEGVSTDNIQKFIDAAGVIDAFWRSVVAGVITVGWPSASALRLATRWPATCSAAETATA